MLHKLKKFWKSLHFNKLKSPLLDSSALTAAVDVDEIFYAGNAAVARGDFSQAEGHYTLYIAHRPKIAKGYIGLGFVLLELERWVLAADVLKQAVTLNACSADGHFMLGQAYRQQGDLQAAESAWDQAYKLAPELEHLYSDYCLLLFEVGKTQKALALMHAGVIRFPDNSKFHFYLGNLLAEGGDYPAAAAHYRIAVNLGDLSPGLFVSFGAALMQVGDREGAIKILEKAQILAPDSARAASNYLLAIQYEPRLSEYEKFAAAQNFSERFEKPLRSQWGNYPGPDDASERKLRIGYVSGDLRTHALAFFFEPIIACHDRSKFEIFCYSNHAIFDHVSQRIQSHADHWVPCYDMSDDALADRIRLDGIDVLVDLSGHTGYNRLLAFARKPAPVQMTWLGYQATTGLQAMDYRITDAALDPIGSSEQFFSEKLIRLPASGTFSPSLESPPVNLLPALDGQPFTFGCLNNPSKITDEAIELWSRILIGNSESRLMIGAATPALIERLSGKFSLHGIGSNRLFFQPKVGLGDYLALHHKIDLALDTFPYNGGTTTFHSLWMGVPVVALAGNSTLSQVGTVVMQGMGLSQFCANNPEQYIERALYFSHHLDQLNQVRQSLRSTMADVTRKLSLEVTRSLEEAMQGCWLEYCHKAKFSQIES